MSSKGTSQILSKAQMLISLQLKKSRTFKPIIISDIDGVLVRGNVPIPQTLQAMQKVINNKIPFACLTNGGGQLQSDKTDKLNKAFNRKLFDSAYMFMNHTPLKPQLIRHTHMKGNLLVTGSLNILGILKDLSVTNFITADELYLLYLSEKVEEHASPEINKLQFHSRTRTSDEARLNVESRLNRKLKIFGEEAQQINSIFAINDVSPYQTSLEVIHNILKCKQEKGCKAIPYYAAQNDTVWAGGYYKPRLAFGPFNFILEEHCRRHHLDLIEHIYYGKPQEKAFNFVEERMRKVQPNGVFFMMGDNPKSDIAGANKAGWYSFLTKTGIHHSSENDIQNPATFVVENFSQAVQIILQAAKQLPK